MRTHVRSESVLDEILEYMYGTARSAHFHAGAFPSGEFDRTEAIWNPLMDVDAVQRDSIHRACYELTREAIVNWLAAILPEDPGVEGAG